MSTLRNRVVLIGHLGQTPETKHFESGKSLSKFSIATNETYKNDKGEQVTETQWHNLVLWGALAKTAEKYLDKGKEVIVEDSDNSIKISTKNRQKEKWKLIRFRALELGLGVISKILI
jgi:single-strand DNA-binding protein